jgi:hypothetical protein
LCLPDAATADESFQILEAFYYGRAFAMTLSRKLGEAVVEVVSDVSKAAAEQPQRWQEFQVRLACSDSFSVPLSL